MSRMFAVMSATTTLEGDLLLFLSVINGTLLLHCEDTALLRACLATYINAARHFKQVKQGMGDVMIWWVHIGGGTLWYGVWHWAFLV